MTFVCEGCAATARDPVFPVGWTGYGMTARKPNATADWCATCRANGTMDKFSVTTHRRAVAIAKSRGLLEKLKGS